MVVEIQAEAQKGACWRSKSKAYANGYAIS